MNVVITVVGEDKVGIVAEVSGVLAAHRGNIIDLSQRVMTGGLFTMIVQASLEEPALFPTLKEKLEQLEEKLNLQITVQREDVFRKMHRI